MNKKNNKPELKSLASDTKSLPRRQLILGASAVASASIVASQPAIAQKTVNLVRNRKLLRMVTSWPADLPGLGTAAQRFADRVTRLSDKKLVIKVFPAGELVSASQNFDSVAKGEAHLYHSFDSYWQTFPK